MRLYSGRSYKHIVEDLLESGASIHEPDSHAPPPVHAAAAFGEAEVLRSLLLKGGDKDSLDGFECTALYRTCYANQDAAFRISLAPSRECIADVVRVLLDPGADASRTRGVL